MLSRADGHDAPCLTRIYAYYFSYTRPRSLSLSLWICTPLPIQQDAAATTKTDLRRATIGRKNNIDATVVTRRTMDRMRQPINPFRADGRPSSYHRTKLQCVALDRKEDVVKNC